ncbi:MAG TPA: DUF5916 domain-containing protein [Vicinamibacterales bacterium]
MAQPLAMSARNLAYSAVLSFVIAAPAGAQTPGNRTPQAGQQGAGAGRSPSEADLEAIRAQRIVVAIHVAEEIVLDGRLNEASWKIALPATDFLQRIPRNGEPASEHTEVRFMYDDDNLYVGVTCFDSEQSRLVVKELKEDFDLNGTDMVQLVIDSLHDRRTAFAFSVNPAGARRDSQFSAGGTNNDWDGVWDAKVSRSEEAWFIEYAIPFKTLRFSTEVSQEWGVQIARRVPRRNEESVWSPIPVRFQVNRLSMEGTLRGLQNLRQGRNLKVKPYVLAQATEARVGNELTWIDSLGRLQGYNGGVDVKYSLTPSLTLDTTYRTDFAQVEADQQQVNLTRFNQFFPEKRDFFLENSGTFSLGGGSQNFQQGGGGGGGNNGGGGGGNQNQNLVPFFSRRIGLNSAGTPVPIIGGGRVTGQAGKYDIGLLAMKTDKSETTPSNNYVVARVKRNILANSSIGVLSTNRDSTISGDYNRVYGGDARLQFFEKLELDAYLLRSETPGKPGLNQARRLNTAWRTNEISTSVEYQAVQPNFIPDVGFVRRTNMSQYSGDFSWLPQMDRSDTIRNLIFSTSVDYFRSATTGDIETRTREARVGAQFENNGNANFIVSQTFDRLVVPFAIRSNLSIPVGDYSYQTYTAEASAGNSRKILTSGNYNWGEFWSGHKRAVTGNLGFRLNHHWSLDVNYNRNQVTLANGAFTTQLFGTRFLYAFNSRAFVNAFFQYNTDTHQVSSNIRFNIIHHPLSDLYVVYNDTRDTANDLLVGKSFAVKLTNLFTF